MSITQVLVSFGLLGLLAAFSSNMIVSQQKQMKLIEQKSESQDLKNELSSTLSKSSICGCHLVPSLTADNSNDENLKFDSTKLDGTEKIPVSMIKSACGTDAQELVKKDKRLLSGLEVESIYLDDLKPTGFGDEWAAKWHVKWKQNSLAGPLKDLQIPQRVKIDTASPGSTATNRLIASCGESNTASCEGLGGKIDPVTGACGNYVGQMARAIFVLQSSGGGPKVIVEDGPSGSRAIQMSGCAPGNYNGDLVCTNSASVIATQSEDVFIYRLSYKVPGSTYAGNYDSIQCNAAQGWRLSGCFSAVSGSDADIMLAPNGCATNDYSQGLATKMTVTCVKNMW
jgi:hypothetical protein